LSIGREKSLKITSSLLFSHLDRNFDVSVAFSKMEDGQANSFFLGQRENGVASLGFDVYESEGMRYVFVCLVIWLIWLGQSQAPTPADSGSADRHIYHIA
jgi:hypothetical protein